MTPNQKRVPNPFIFGTSVPATHFVGREGVINNCFNRLAGTIRISTAISGERGIGRTSVLNYIANLAQKEQWGPPEARCIYIYIDCQALRPFSATRFWHFVLQHLKELEYSFNLSERIDRLLEISEVAATDIQRLLRWLSRQGIVIVLLLDGFSSIIEEGVDETMQKNIGYFLSGLRALANQPEGALTMLTATREPLNIVCAEIVRKMPGSEFYNNFAFEFLPPFSDDEVNVLFERMLENSEIQFGKMERNLIDKLAGHHPALLQMASFHVFEVRRSGPLTSKSYKEVVDDFIASARHYFESFWNNSSPLDQSLIILTILLHLPPESPTEPKIHQDEMRHLLRRYERDVMHLGDRGLIRPENDTHYTFSTGFMWWVVHEVAAVDEAILTDQLQSATEEPLRRAWLTLKERAPYLTLDRLTQAIIDSRSLPESPPTIQVQAGEAGEDTPTTQSVTESPTTETRYELQDELGRGASGIVHKAFDHHLGRTVAIKLINDAAFPSVGDSDLLKEAQTASKLQHSNIVTIFDAVEVNGQIWLIMEFLDGWTLAGLLNRATRFPLKRVVGIVEQAADALDYAHSQGVIHRDVKPANLMITKAGKVKLADFGIAKITKNVQTLQSSGFKGTVNYMSPEQLDEEPLDGRSDLFSLAIVTFEMLSGKLPWPGETFRDIMNQIAEKKPLTLAEAGFSGPTALESIFQKALAKNPAERFQYGAEFTRILKQIMP